MHTKDLLAQELRKAGLDAMADKAAEGYYHDYLSPLALPASQLMDDLKAAGADDLIKRHLNGDFDATFDEADEWAKSEEGSEMLRRFLRL